MMKKWQFLLPLLLTIACSKEGRKIHISGEIPETGKSMVYLDEVQVNTTLRKDSARIRKNGSFAFTVRAKEPNFYQVRISPNNFITLLAEPGEKIRISSGNPFLSDGYTVTGSEGSSQIKILDDQLLKTQRTLDSIISEFRSNMDMAGFDTLQARLDKEYIQAINDQRRFSIGFILENLHSLASIKALYQKFDTATYVLYDMKDLQYLKIVADSLTVYYPGSKHTKALVADLRTELDQFNSQRISSLINSAASRDIEIALPNPKGDTISLSSLRGKFVLLSFWASWDNPSVKENIELKKLYGQYHPKGFEIYQVSLDNDREAWERAIRFDQLPWISVSDLQYPNSPAISLFNIQKIPANYLLDREGTIIGKDFTSRALKIKLGQLFD